MAESSHPLGYQCEFIDTVHGNFYCMKCSLVARRLTLASCCGESYCHACIADIQQQDIPCKECGQQNFTTIKPLKYQRQMDGLKVYCSMRREGCDWSGTLGQLDAHLDPEQNHCQYVDIKCPLHCEYTIPRNKVVQHVASECGKRDHVCQYCGFRDTYEVVVDTHWTQCIFFPLQCPNFCGVTCERDVMGDHMSMCRLEEVACEFSGVGCSRKFRREDQEEHTRKNNQLHLTMTASAAVKMNKQLQQKLQQQEQKLQQQEQKLQELENRHEQKSQEQEIEFKNKFKEQEKRCQEQEQKFQEQEQKFQEQECKFQEEMRKTEKELERNMHEQVQKVENFIEQLELKFHSLLQERDKRFVKLQERTDENEVAVKEVENFISLKRTFSMENFSKEREKDKSSDWKSPAMYTHVRGYKFCVGIDANGYGSCHGQAMRIEVWAMQGEYDHQLKWPTQASFTIELLNQHGGENIIHILTKVEWDKPAGPYQCLCSFGRRINEMNWVFIEHSKLEDFLANDVLYFWFSNIEVTCDVHSYTMNH